MAGRPITNNSVKARRNREYMRRVRQKQTPAPINPQPLAKALANWKPS